VGSHRKQNHDTWKVLRGALPAPLLHGVSGSSGFWDEVFSFGLIGGAVVVLGTLAVLGGRRKKGRSGRRKRKKGRK
jgi:hypothetical protein